MTWTTKLDRARTCQEASFIEANNGAKENKSNSNRRQRKQNQTQIEDNEDKSNSKSKTTKKNQINTKLKTTK